LNSGKAGLDPAQIQTHGAHKMGITVRDEGKKVNSNINVTPMVDVMLVLLIIFMVITPMLQNKVAIDLARVENPTPMPDADKEDAVVVAVTRDGAIYLGQNKIDPAQLGSQVQQKLQDKTDKTIYVRADARAQFKVVEEAIDDVRTAGVEEVGLLTQKREGNTIGGQ
jgi:biopolymer transport protein ExbD/biopolymer transport protein TolR